MKTAWAVLAAVLPSTAFAHGFDERYDLPAPLAYFVIGAAATVALSFLIAVLFVRGAPVAPQARNGEGKCKGLLIAVPRDSLPEQPEGEYYWSDLVGLSVENLAGEKFGNVDSLLETGANDVLVVKGESGEKLIPFIDSVIKHVSLKDKTIRVDWQADYLK